jgi:tetratricopeptide (TPR) repeat protein
LRNFETILNQVESLNRSPEVVRWSARGRAIFHPTYINARALMAVAKNAEEMASLASVLRQLGNYPVAIQVAGQSERSSAVDDAVSLMLHRNRFRQSARWRGVCVEVQPSDPMSYILLAKATEKAGDLPVAMEALEAGISLWPNEPEWHAWAAELAVKAGIYYADVEHWRRRPCWIRLISIMP